MVKDRTIQFFSSQYSSRHHLRTLKYSNQVHFLFCLRWYVLYAKVLCSSKRGNVTRRCIRKTDNLNLACLILFYPDTMTVSVEMLGSHQLFYHTKKIDRIAHVLTKYLNTALISGLSWHSSPHIWVPTSGSYQKVLRILKRRKKPFFSMFAIFAE